MILKKNTALERSVKYFKEGLKTNKNKTIDSLMNFYRLINVIVVGINTFFVFFDSILIKLAAETLVNPFKSSILVMGHLQTVENQALRL